MSADDILRTMIGDLILQIAMLRGRVAQLEALNNASEAAATQAAAQAAAQMQEAMAKKKQPANGMRNNAAESPA